MDWISIQERKPKEVISVDVRRWTCTSRAIYYPQEDIFMLDKQDVDIILLDVTHWKS